MKSWTLLLASSKFTRDGLVSAPCDRVRTGAAGNLRTEAGAGRSLAAAGSRSCVRSFSGGRGTTRLQINGDKEDTGLYLCLPSSIPLSSPRPMPGRRKDMVMAGIMASVMAAMSPPAAAAAAMSPPAAAMSPPAAMSCSTWPRGPTCRGQEPS